MKILLIDDDASFRKLLEIRLRATVSGVPGAEALEFTQFGSLAEAGRVDRSIVWDLVAIDQHLGDGLGVDFLARNPFPESAVLMLSSDSTPEIPGDAMRAGATFFLSKTQLGEPLFKPLVLGLIERSRLAREVAALKAQEIEQATVRTLVGTLKHEINNPLGVVMGAAFLVKETGALNDQQRKAAEMIEASGQRIKEVVNRLSDVTQLERTSKAGVEVFNVPGDAGWGKA
jgi:signal transduction histidine kinase